MYAIYFHDCKGLFKDKKMTFFGTGSWNYDMIFFWEYLELKQNTAIFIEKKMNLKMSSAAWDHFV